MHPNPLFFPAPANRVLTLIATANAGLGLRAPKEDNADVSSELLKSMLNTNVELMKNITLLLHNLTHQNFTANHS